MTPAQKEVLKASICTNLANMIDFSRRANDPFYYSNGEALQEYYAAQDRFAENIKQLLDAIP